VQRVAREYMLPIFKRLGEVLRQGVEAGEFRPLDPVHFVPSMVALVVFYFSSAPVMKSLLKFDPLSPERIAERRAFVLDFVSAALFVKR
jgi:hypothetical protein